MNLYQYLCQIRDGKAINLKLFLAKLPDDLSADKDRHLSYQLVAKNRYLVEFNQPEMLARLLSDNAPVDSRAQAALQGDSHQKPCQFSSILVFHQLCHQGRPDVVVTREQGVNQGFVSKPRLLLIENQDNFFQFAAMLAIESEFIAQDLSLDNTDIAFARGNEIANELNRAFLAQYPELLCAFDYDYGGLKIFRSLSALLPEQKCRFLMPQDFHKFKPAFCHQPADQQKLLKAVTLAQTLGFSELAQMFKATGRFMEQEALLADAQPQNK